MNEFKELVNSFHGRRIAVIGDLVVDRYIHGNTRRISREAPVLIVREDSQEARLGGAANVVANIHALEGEPVPVGLVGADDNGNWLLQELANRGISPEGVIVDPNRFTTTKTRVLAGGRNTVRQQMLRIDRINDGPVTEPIRSNLVSRLRQVLKSIEALVVSDYREGVVEEEVFAEIQEIATAGRVPVFVDARRGIERFCKAEALVPNEPELAAATGRDLNGGQMLQEAARSLLEQTDSNAVVVKRGRNGMGLFLKDGRNSLREAYGLVEVADVTGAGDTVIAAYSLACCAGADPVQAAHLANIAGGIKVTKAGTAVVNLRELQGALGG